MKYGQIKDEQILYENEIFELKKIHIKTPDNMNIERDLINHKNVVCVLALEKNTNEVLINEEYRTGVNKKTLSLPAGMIEQNELPLDAAKREIKEETGFKLINAKTMICITTSEGFTNEHSYLIVGYFDKHSKEQQNFDDDEFITTKLFNYNDVLEMIKNSTISSGQSVANISYYETFFKEKN